MTQDDTGLTRPPATTCVSTHKDEVRSIDHGYFQSQFRVSVYKEVGRPTHDSIKREQTLVKVTNVFMTNRESMIRIVSLHTLSLVENVEKKIAIIFFLTSFRSVE